MKFNRMYNGATEYCPSCGKVAGVKNLNGDTTFCNSCLFEWRTGEHTLSEWMPGCWFRRDGEEWQQVPNGCLWILREKRVCRTKARCVA